MRLRVTGTPDEVDLTLEVLSLTPLVLVEQISRPYACRDSVDQVRVYVTVRPLTQLPGHLAGAHRVEVA